MCHCIFFRINPRVSKHHAFRLHRATSSTTLHRHITPKFGRNVPLDPSRCVLELNICNGKNKAGLIRILLICSFSVLQPIEAGFNSIRPLIDQATVLAENSPLTLSVRKSLWADRSRTMAFSCNFTHPQNVMGNCSSTIRTCFDKLITFETQRLENGLIC